MLEAFSFVMTEDGRHGLVHGETKEGDFVYVAYASGYRLALRKDDMNHWSYKFVGCGIMEELMDGEVMEMPKVGTLEGQTILLR